VTRPIYHRDEDAELAVGEAIAEWVGAEMIKTDEFCCFDFLALRGGQLVGILEVKCRNNPIYEYPSLMLSKQKVDRILQASELLRVPALLAVSFLGQIAVMDLSGFKDLGPARYGERTDRGDKMDRELVYDLPIDRFRTAPVAAGGSARPSASAR
jgi:hypothetical protein